MKTIYYATFVFMIFSCWAIANPAMPKGKYTKEKKISKTFMVASQAQLSVDNKYGNVDIVSWNENKIEILITVTTSGNNENAVEKQLDAITIDFMADKNTVSAKTLIASRTGGWNFWGRGNQVNMQINYLIKMPVTNHLSVQNNYGAVSLDVLQGNTSISCNYGKLILGELLGNENTLKFNYTNNSTIRKATKISILANYSEFNIDESESVNFQGNYTTTSFGEVKNLEFDSDYGKITVLKCENVTGSGNYITKKFGTVEKNINIRSRYGSLSIERLEKSIEKVIINGRYTSIKIGFDSKANFHFAGNTSYAGIKGIEHIELQTKIEQNTRKTYEGYYGAKESKNTFTIQSDYGGVTLNKL